MVGQLSPSLASTFAEQLGALSVEDASRLRNDIHIAVVKLLTEYTGEESGRFTDKERKIAEEASRLTDVTADVTQVRQGLVNVLKLKIMRQMRNLIALNGRPRHDLLAKDSQARREAVNSLGNELVSYGMTKDEAFEIILDIESVQKEIEKIAGLKND